MTFPYKKPLWEILSEHVYESFPIFTLKRSRRRNPRTKVETEYVRIDGLDWAIVLPFTTSGNLVLIRQYRHGAEEYTIELPGGCVEADEAKDPAHAALRELEEETGYTLSPSGSMTHLGSLSPNPALMGNQVHCFMAEGVVKKGAQNLDPGEDIEVLERPWTDYLQDIQTGKISHALNVAAVGFYLLRQR